MITRKETQISYTFGIASKRWKGKRKKVK